MRICKEQLPELETYRQARKAWCRRSTLTKPRTGGDWIPNTLPSCQLLLLQLKLGAVSRMLLYKTSSAFQGTASQEVMMLSCNFLSNSVFSAPPGQQGLIQCPVHLFLHVHISRISAEPHSPGQLHELWPWSQSSSTQSVVSLTHTNKTQGSCDLALLNKIKPQNLLNLRLKTLLLWTILFSNTNLSCCRSPLPTVFFLICLFFSSEFTHCEAKLFF